MFRIAFFAWIFVLSTSYAKAIHFPPAAKNPSAEDVLETIELALSPVRAKHTVHLDEMGAWAVVHGILALENDIYVTGGPLKEKEKRALQWLSEGGTCGGYATFKKTASGIRGQCCDPKKRLFIEVFEGHPAQFFGYLSDLELDTSTPWSSWDAKSKKWVEGTFGDIVEDAKAQTGINVHPDYIYEMTWLLWGLSRYIDADETWKNSLGQSYSLEKILAIELKQGINKKTSCAGTHRLYAMDVAVKNYQAKHGTLPLKGTFQKAEQYVKTHIALAKQFQNRDGSFSGDVFFSSRMAKTWSERVASNGHVLEFLMQALPDERLTEPWVLRGVQSVALDIYHGESDEVGDGALFHATHALRLFEKRIRESK